jgi:hypothetical protein
MVELLVYTKNCVGSSPTPSLKSIFYLTPVPIRVELFFISERFLPSVNKENHFVIKKTKCLFQGKPLRYFNKAYLLAKELNPVF